MKNASELCAVLQPKLQAHPDTNFTLPAHELRTLCDAAPSDPIATALTRMMDQHPTTNPKIAERYNPLTAITVPTAHAQYLTDRAKGPSQTATDAERPPTPLGPSVEF